MEKTILIALAVIGAILFFGLLTPPVEPPPTERQALVDTGHFVLERAGVPIVEEDYTLFFSSEEGYMLLSQTTVSVGDEVIAMAQQYQFDRDFMPFLYHLAAETPSGAQLISAQMGIAGLHMEARVGLAQQSADVPDVRNTIILDENLISHYVVLLMAAEAETIARDFTAAVPQALLALPSHLDGPSTVTFSSGEAMYEGKVYELQVGELGITLVTYEGRLAGVITPSQATIAYNADLFPEGILLEPRDESTSIWILKHSAP